ncbi:hypothetical protein C0583_00625 [Candidatus Parcubacteria bacterium]|nr:MAG: hypothetical protein C0583_00625 [Candidatus Parcubacteria bacterium]
MSEILLNNYNKYKNKIYNYFWYRFDFNTAIAEDLTREVFMQAFKEIETYDKSKSFEAWIYSLAYNNLRSRYPMGAKRVNLSRFKERLLINFFDEELVKSKWVEVIFRILSLPEKYREVLLLRYVDKLDNKSLSSIFDLEKGDLRARLKRSLKVLDEIDKEYSKDIDDVFASLPQIELGEMADKKIKIKLFGSVARKEMEGVNFFYFHRKTIVVTTMALLLLIITGLPSYAYASKGVVPGHSLYSLKTAIEELEYTVSQDKAETLLKFSVRRMEEANTLAQNDAEEKNIILLINEARVVKEQALLMERIENISEKAIDNYQNSCDDALRKIASKVGIETSEGMLNTLVLAIEEVKTFDKNSSNKKSDEVKEVKDESKKIIDEEIEEVSKNKVKEEIEAKNKEVDRTEEESPKVIEPNEESSLKTEKDNQNNNDNKNSKNNEDLSMDAQEEEESAKVIPPTANSANNLKEKTEKIKKIKEDVEEMTEELKNSSYREDDVKKLIEKINDKIKKAEEEENLKQAEIILEPAQALTKNADYFIKKENDNKKDKQ